MKIVHILISLFISTNISGQIIEQIIIRNNHKTKDWVIHRELLFKQGDTLTIQDENILQRSKENLYNTRLFNDIIIHDTVINKQRTILITVEERWYLWPYLILEHADRNLATYIHNEQWNRINYGIMTTKHNFRGRNENLSFKFRMGFRQQLAINYFIPHISKSIDKIGLLFDISLFRQKSTFYTIIDNKYQFAEYDIYAFCENRYKAGLIFRPQYNIKHYLLSTIHTFNLKETTQEINNSLMGTRNPINNWFIFDYVFEYNTLDYILYPTKGSLVIFSLSAATDKNTNYWQNIYFNANINIPTHNRISYSTSFFGEHYFTAAPPVGLRRSICNNYHTKNQQTRFIIIRYSILRYWNDYACNS